MELVLSSFKLPLLVFPPCSQLLQSLSQSRDVPFCGSHPLLCGMLCWDFGTRLRSLCRGLGGSVGGGCSKAHPVPSKVLSPLSPSPLEQELSGWGDACTSGWQLAGATLSLPSQDQDKGCPMEGAPSLSLPPTPLPAPREPRGGSRH